MTAGGDGVTDWARDLAFAGRQLGMAGGRRWRRLRSGGLELWRARSPGTYERLRGLVARPAPPEAPPPPPPPYGETVAIDGLVMRIDERMSAHNVRKLVSGRHTQHERKLLQAVLGPDDVVMELGGGIGMVAIACAKKIGSERVFSFEANPRLESLIRDNYALNDVAPTLKMCMLGPEAGGRTFYVAPRFSRSSIYGAEDDEAVEAQVEPFNCEIARIRPTVLIVDIQGGEAELFDYADLRGVRTLLLEVHTDIIGVRRTLAIRRYLRRMDFAETSASGQSFLYSRDH